MLAAYGALQACVLPVYLITGGHDVEITGEPTTSELIVLVIVGLALPFMAVVGWLVSRSRSGRTRAAVATLAVVIVAIVGTTAGGPAQLAQEAVVVAAVLVLTGCGVGSVVGWAVRTMLSHLATVGALAVRALPVVLLTALVFFNSYVWIMADDDQRGPAGTGDGIPAFHRRGLRRLRHQGTGQADAPIVGGRAPQRR